MNAKDCLAGQENVEKFYNQIVKKNLIQYDFRTVDGELFSCVSPSLLEARKRRDKWLAKRQNN